MQLRMLAVPAVAGLALVACGSTDNSTSSSSSSGAASGAATSSSTTAACATGTITASGSTALQPLVQQAAQAYQAKCPGSTITVSGGGSSTGLSNVASGASDIGDSDVPVSNAKAVDPTTVTDHQVAIAVFAVIVNPKTGVTNLTTQQVRDIFSGKDTNWSQVGGANVPITLVERKTGSGTRLSFDKDIMQGTPEAANPASTQDSTQLVLTSVAGPAGGVSYLVASSADSTVTKVNLDGVAPTGDNVKNGTYKYFSHEHMYTKTSASPLATSFIAFMLSSDFQNSTVAQAGYLPEATTTEQSLADK
ncbi:MAG TPA: phosphate ABC transporter substrate-binding protein PstS family protein [Candidatus Dormibacteraeota bacterium]|nr:phosphate ABC transporter substrate-binding protein PstS family protein [Candidatus Dormibacteraeota bacterium]